MNRLLNLMLLCCFGVSMAWAQSPCVNSTLLNGNAENGATPTNISNNINLANGFSAIWSRGSTADYYDQTHAASNFTPPIPATGDYVSCWIAKHTTTYREGFQMSLGTTIMPNTGVHTLMMDMACLNSANAWGSVEVGIYGVNNPNNTLVSRPTATTPTNMNLFGPSNTVLIGAVPHTAANCSPQKVQYSFAINSNDANFPAAGISHIFVTRSDASPGGGLYMAFDNFCVTPPVLCQNSIIANGNLETGTPTNISNNIDLAAGFSSIWSLARGSSSADYYDQTHAAGGFSLPSPATGDYASCWITHSNDQRYREGFQFELDVALPPNTGTYTLSFDMGCLDHSWGGGVEVGVYGLHNPSNAVAPTPTATTPTNINLFGAANTMLLQVIPQPPTGCDGTKTVRFVNINTNAANFPAGGMTHVFITRNDGAPGGSAYMAFDNFCLSVNDSCAGNFSVNGNLETGVPNNTSNNIDLANGFSGIWTSGSTADYYDQFTAATGIPPIPATGDYASCWIANHITGGTLYREGFTNQLAAPILPNTGMYELTFDMGCLNGWGISEVAIYGINNPSGGLSVPVTGAFTPNNPNLFGAANTFLAGIIPVNSTNCNSVKTTRTVWINSNASNFPANGITHLMITHSDNTSINGALYMAFDDFCVHTIDVPCPTYGGYKADCLRDQNKDGRPDYNLWFNFGNDMAGSVQLTVNCGGLTTSTFTLDGSGTYNTTLLSGNCTNYTVTYTIFNAFGEVCTQRTMVLRLPRCPVDCTCGRGFKADVAAGFSFVEDCPKNIFTPYRLKKCDRVDWFVDGTHVGTTNGNTAFSYPHSNRPYRVCMRVTRRDMVNQVACRETFCFDVKPRIACWVNSGGGLSSFSKIKVQPNPAQKQATVTWSTENVSDQINISVYNVQGVRVLEMFTVNGHDGSLVLDLSTLANGVYYIRAEGEGYVTPPVKLLKQ